MIFQSHPDLEAEVFIQGPEGIHCSPQHICHFIYEYKVTLSGQIHILGLVGIWSSINAYCWIKKKETRWSLNKGLEDLVFECILRQVYVGWHAYRICPLWVGPHTWTTRVCPDMIRCNNTWKGFILELYEMTNLKLRNNYMCADYHRVYLNMRSTTKSLQKMKTKTKLQKVFNSSFIS